MLYPYPFSSSRTVESIWRRWKSNGRIFKTNPNISYSIAIIVTKHDYKYKKNNNEYIFEFDQYKKICCFICYLNEGKLVNNPIKPNIIKENDQELLKI